MKTCKAVVVRGQSVRIVEVVESGNVLKPTDKRVPESYIKDGPLFDYRTKTGRIVPLFFVDGEAARTIDPRGPKATVIFEEGERGMVLTPSGVQALSESSDMEALARAVKNARFETSDLPRTVMYAVLAIVGAYVAASYMGWL